MKKRAKLADPLPIKEVLGTLFRGMDMDGKMDDFKILQAWNGFVGTAAQTAMAKKLQEYTFAHRITRERVLVVGVRSAVMANELQFMKPMLEAKFVDLIAKQDLPEIEGIVFELRT